MGKRLISLLVLSAAACFAGPALAVVCYTVLDQSNTVIYRGYEPPIDMSAAGNAAREAMRQRGEFLMVSYVDDCLLVSASRWTGGYTAPASVEDIVAGMRPFASGAPSGVPSSVGGLRQPALPSLGAGTGTGPAARSSSTGTKSGY
jgi:hypothetical protein